MEKYKITLLFLLSIFLFACNNDDNIEVSTDTLTLQASSDTLLLAEERANETAVTFTWNKGRDVGAENTVVYIFRLDIYGSDFKTSTEPIEIEADGELSVSYSHKELNDLIIKKWGYYAGDDVKLQARVVAKVTGPKFVYPEISTVDIEAKTYIVAPKPLYLIGDATSAGFDPTKVIKLTEEEIGVFYHWKGTMTSGSFKFITTVGQLLPSLNKGTDSNTLVERKAQSDPDNMFTISRNGTYAIALFREELRIVYKFVPYPNVWLIGNATSAEWSIDNALEMKWDPKNPNIFTFEGDLKGGELKLPTMKDWSAATFRPLVADGSIHEEGVQVYQGGDDLKWKINDNEAGKYKITLDTENMKIKFEKQ